MTVNVEQIIHTITIEPAGQTIVIQKAGTQGVVGPAGPTGPAGPAGPAGPEGPAGASQVPFEITHTWAISGEIAVPVGEDNVIPPMKISERANQTTELIRVDFKHTTPGATVDFDMKKNGAGMAGFTGIQATNSWDSEAPAAVGVASGDEIAPVVTAIAGTPKNLSITATFLHTVDAV